MEENIQTKIIAKCWKDPEFKKRFLKSPQECLKEMGIEVPKNIKVKAIEDQKDQFTFVLPSHPTNLDELSEKELQELVGGVCMMNTGGWIGK